MARYAEDERRANGPVWGLGGKLTVDNTRAKLQSLSMSGLERQQGRGSSALGTACAKLYKPGTLLISVAQQERVRWEISRKEAGEGERARSDQGGSGESP